MALTIKYGICDYCKKYKKFSQKNICYNCWDKYIRGKKKCKHCGKIKRVAGLGLCRYCYFKHKGYLIKSYKSVNPYRSNTARRRAFKVQSKCYFCDENRLKMLDVHHIDNNHSNNSVNNLILLCPNHHREVHLGLSHIPKTNP
jgi:hypothetical protein